MTSVLDGFSSRTAHWFRENVGQPTAAQELGWPAIISGEHALISAPTGTGKTLAAFLVFVDRLSEMSRNASLVEQLYVLYISPLKALGNDIRENLKRPIEGIPCPAVRVAVRTGDTDASERRAMIKHPPHILITTPESLYLLLTSKSGRDMLVSTQSVIVDELHALIDTKRGAHLMLSLARLDALCGRSIQRIALSATIRPLECAARFLAAQSPIRIVAPDTPKSRDLRVDSVVPDMRVLPKRTIWPELARAVHDQCEGARTVIAFVEGRAQAEKLAHGVNEIAGEGFARTHHGCVSKQQRLEAERQLKAGELRLLCATSSMELGIDVGEVDRVLQIGCPMTVSGTLQRLGRAGHNPGRTSVMRIFPRMVSEVVACGMTATAALEGDIEPSKPPKHCLDIVAQHMVSMAAEGTYTVEALHAIVQSAHSFRDVTFQEVEGVLRMLAGDYEHELDQPARPRLLYDRIHGTVSGDTYTRMLALSSGGTIPDRGWFPVTLADGTRLGELDEEYVFEARVGDKFLLGAFAWRMLEIRKDRVVVASASVEGAQVPFWKGDGRGRAYEVALRFGAILRSLNEAHRLGTLLRRLNEINLDEHAAVNAMRHVERQIELTGCLPDDHTIVVEHFADEAGEHQMMVHSVFGRRVNAAMEMLVRRAAARATGLDVHSYCDEDGFLLYVMGDAPLPEGLLYAIDPERAPNEIHAMLPATPLFTMSFRYNANRALMMGVRKGGRLPLWVQRLRGAQALALVAEHAQHPLLLETMRECEQDYLDLDALVAVLRGIRSGEIAVRELHSDAPSPMALPLRRQAEATMMYEYSPIPIAAVRASEAALATQDAIAPVPSALTDAATRPYAQDADRLHSMLMAEGDMLAQEVGAPLMFLEQLLMQGRALYVDPGLWIAAEHEALYLAAFDAGDAAARARIVRRCLRYRGAQTPQTLLERYQIVEEEGAVLLETLVREGVAIAYGDAFYHRTLYERAVRETVAIRRREGETRPQARFAQYLSVRAQTTASPPEQLARALDELREMAYPPEAWEGFLLPGRVDKYRPKLLDDLMAHGAWVWTLSGDKRPLLSFHRYEDIDWDAEPGPGDIDLTEDERALFDALKLRGASFAHALSPLLGGRSALDALLSLTEQGLVRADSFAPIRLMISKADMTGKRRARTRVHAQDAGRWALTRPPIERGIERAIERTFDRYALVCRETYDGKWGEALELLRIWEYTGRVRRGYFVRGLSGAQFLRAEEYGRVVMQMAAERPQVIWMNAADPMQAWGRFLTHEPERTFMLVAGTAVALSAGQPIMVLERGGEALRVFDESLMDEALHAFVTQFALGRIYGNLGRVTVKRSPDAARPALERAGFVREMMDYVLWRDA